MKTKLSNMKKFVGNHKISFATATGITIGASVVIGGIVYVEHTKPDLLLNSILKHQGVWGKIEEGFQPDRLDKNLTNSMNR